eukprot:11956-Heterococcus_DN1.PRE.3
MQARTDVQRAISPYTAIILMLPEHISSGIAATAMRLSQAQQQSEAESSTMLTKSCTKCQNFALLFTADAASAATACTYCYRYCSAANTIHYCCYHSSSTLSRLQVLVVQKA